MKKIAEGEEFQMGDRVFSYTLAGGKITIIPGKKVKGFAPPTLEETITFFKEEGYTKEHATKVWKYYNDADWKDSHNKPVKNWKQKMRGNWMKDEGKTPAVSGGKNINFFQTQQD